MSKSADELQRAKWLSLLRIVLIYAGFASLWILLSDEAVLLITTEPHRMVQTSQYKGWAFVFITSLLLLWLLTRHWKKYVAALRADGDPATAGARGQQLQRRHLCQRPAGRYLLFNRAACDIVGKRLNDVLGQDDRSLFPAEAHGGRPSIDSRRMGRSRTPKRPSRPPWASASSSPQGGRCAMRMARSSAPLASRATSPTGHAEAEIAHFGYHDQLTGSAQSPAAGRPLCRGSGVARRAWLWGPAVRRSRPLQSASTTTSAMWPVTP